MRMPTFADLGLSSPLVEALRHLGYERPTPIQEKAIPVLLDGRDVIGQAQTGTGKTAAFGLPLLDFVDPSNEDVQALVLTPTRELCIQVTQALRAYGERRGVDVVAVFGGAPIRNQVDQLKRGPQVVVGTVGRVMDLMGRHQLVLNAARFVVLDEADEMLDLGFLEDVETILSRCPSGRQTGLFSATMPPEIRRLAETWMFDPETIKVKAATLTIDTVEQFAVEVGDRDKPDALARVLKAERPDQAIVFVRTKIGVDRLARSVSNKGVRVKALHGDMSQGARDGVMIAFKEGREPLLVATDIAARGLDISGVTHILNYDMPNSPDLYVHRIGRTGRVGRSGRAITFVTPRQRRELEAIERHAGIAIAEWSPDAAASGATDGAGPGGGRRRRAGKESAPADAASGNGADAGAQDTEEATATAAGVAAAAPQPAPGADPPGGRSAVRPREPRRLRHTKPSRPAEGPSTKLVVGAGRAQGLEPADVISAIVDHSRLEGEDIRNVRMLERFSLVEVPRGRADEVVAKVHGCDVRGVSLRVEIARP
jgi:ATP-dependent RNA helicase DeaD